MITYPLNNIDYTAEDAELFHCTRTSGIWAEDSFSISVTGADNNVTIGTGIAWINNEEFSGKVTALKTAKVLDVGVADGVHPRIDVIAIQFNANNNATDIIIKKGTPATNPVRPAIVRSGAVYELYLASVYRPAGATTITASNITDLRMDETVCGLMADSVTKIDTKAINDQIEGLISKLESEIEGVKDTTGFMFKSDWVENDVISIARGGTGARTEKEVRSILGVGVEKIWTNVNPTKEFSAGEKVLIASQLQKFDKFIVEFKVSTSIDRHVSFIATKHIESCAHWIENVHVAGKLRICGRLFRINSTSFILEDAHEKDIDVTSATVNNKKLIPVNLYGFATHAFV